MYASENYRCQTGHFVMLNMRIKMLADDIMNIVLYYLVYNGLADCASEFTFLLILHAFLFSAVLFFEINFFGIPLECQTVWIQTRPGPTSGFKLFARVISR